MQEGKGNLGASRYPDPVSAYKLRRIRHKSDEESLQQLRQLGYPAVGPLIPHLLEWIQDPNWPVCLQVTEFLASLGRPALPEIRKVLLGSDDIWKLSCLYLLRRMDPKFAMELRPEISRIASSPTPGEASEEVSEEARGLLLHLGGAEAP
ncbi:MAG: hypothetical protein FD180_796 [Planctomycetota bacterium]|nr:MAG: hypothetical protein FD180_796 [Planctomycetota bacterium]